MSKLYFVRHGQTDWNVAGKMQGREDIPLNQNGESQAELLATFFEKTPLDVVYSSPLVRAKKTAETIANKKEITVMVDNRFIERDFGLLSGAPFSALHDRTETDEELGIEAYGAIRERAVSALSEMDEQQVRLVVTHGVTLAEMLASQGFGFSLDKQTQGVVYCIEEVDGEKVCYVHDLVNERIDKLKTLKA